MTLQSQDRALALLVDRATEGLDATSSSELDTLLARHPELDSEAFDLAAAALELAYTVPERSLPPALRQRVSQQAAEYFAGTEATVEMPAATVEMPAATVEKHAATVEKQAATVVSLDDRRPSADAGFDATRWLGWLAAAAILAIVLTQRTKDPSVVTPPTSESPPIASQPAPLTAAQQRAALLARGDELIRLAWTATEDPYAGQANGDVVWSGREQSGYMRFAGLPVNDPTREQYQLWIFDAEQDERYPIDGGVFDIPSDGEVVVPIVAKLHVAQATLFAITVEKPGGVVVSTRERLPLLAQVG